MSGVAYKKIYVQVDVSFSDSGQLRPHTLTWSDGRKYTIDRILDVRPSHADKVGGQGDRYKVRIMGLERYLFFEHNPNISSPAIGRWFVEGKA